MSNTETPEYVNVVESTYRTVEHGEHTFEVKEYDTGALQCPKCSSTAKSVSSLKQHITHSHNITARVEYECGYRNCGETFTGLETRDRTFCSHSCATKEHQATEDIEAHTNICENCGVEFKTPPSQDKMYCSADCYNDDHRKTLTCPTCDETFTVPASTEQTYCSRMCFARRHWQSLEKR